MIFFQFFFPFFQFFELYFWRTPSNPYPLITHTLACPPIGMGYEVFYCITFS